MQHLTDYLSTLALINMRIGFFTDSYLPRLDGIAVSVESFRSALEREGHEVYVFCPTRPEPFKEPTKRIYRFKSVSMGMYEGYRQTLPYLPRHMKYIKNLDLDIIHVHTPTQIGSLGIYAAKKFNIPLATTCHSDFSLAEDYKWLKIVFGLTTVLTSLATKNNMSVKQIAKMLQPKLSLKKWDKKVVSQMIKHYYSLFDLIITPSQKIQNDLKRYKIKTEVLPTGIPGVIKRTSTQKAARAQFGIDTKVFVYVSTSRPVKEKRIDFIIKAFGQIKNTPNAMLAIAGDGPEIPKLKELCDELNLYDQVRFFGQLPHADIFKLLQACDVLVHSSIRETQGLVLNEAAVIGLPVLLIDEDINPIFIDDKSCLRAKNSVPDFAKKMQILAHSPDLRKKLASSARQNSRKYTEPIQAKKLLDFYAELLSS